MTDDWHAASEHFFFFAIFAAALVAINFFTVSTVLWSIWPLLGWAVVLILHFAHLLLGEGTEYSNNKTLQAVDRYKKEIDDVVKKISNRTGQDHLQDLPLKVAHLVQAIKELAKSVEQYKENELIHQDIESVMQAIGQLENQLKNEKDTEALAELEHALGNRQKQLAALENLKSTMKRAEMKIESTVAALGIIYIQILASQSTNDVADYGRLSAEVDEEVYRLQDHLEALDEVKLGVEPYPPQLK